MWRSRENMIVLYCRPLWTAHRGSHAELSFRIRPRIPSHFRWRFSASGVLTLIGIVATAIIRSILCYTDTSIASLLSLLQYVSLSPQHQRLTDREWINIKVAYVNLSLIRSGVQTEGTHYQSSRVLLMYRHLHSNLESCYPFLCIFYSIKPD